MVPERYGVNGIIRFYDVLVDAHEQNTRVGNRLYQRALDCLSSI